MGSCPVVWAWCRSLKDMGFADGQWAGCSWTTGALCCGLGVHFRSRVGSLPGPAHRSRAAVALSGAAAFVFPVPEDVHRAQEREILHLRQLLGHRRQGEVLGASPLLCAQGTVGISLLTKTRSRDTAGDLPRWGLFSLACPLPCHAPGTAGRSARHVEGVGDRPLRGRVLSLEGCSWSPAPGPAQPQGPLPSPGCPGVGLRGW